MTFKLDIETMKYTSMNGRYIIYPSKRVHMSAPCVKFKCTLDVGDLMPDNTGEYNDADAAAKAANVHLVKFQAAAKELMSVLNGDYDDEEGD